MIRILHIQFVSGMFAVNNRGGCSLVLEHG